MAAANDAMYPLEKHKPALGSLRQPQIAEAREFCFSKGYIAPRKGWGAFQYRVGTAVSAGQPSQPPCTLSPSPLMFYKKRILTKSNKPLKKVPLREASSLLRGLPWTPPARGEGYVCAQHVVTDNGIQKLKT